MRFDKILLQKTSDRRRYNAPKPDISGQPRHTFLCSRKTRKRKSSVFIKNIS